MFEKIGSLPRRIPYWTTLAVQVKSHAALPNHLASVLVLKDGTLAMGFRAAGVDLYAASDAALNGYSAAVAQALRGLPGDTYLQAVFESGASFEGLVQRFGAQSAAHSSPLLKRGRQLRCEELRACGQRGQLTRCEITYWLGWKQALKALTGGRLHRLRHGTKGDSGERVRQATQLLVDVVTRFMDALESAGLRTELLSEHAMLEACHRALNPTSYHRFPAPRYLETPDDMKAYQAGEPLVLRGPALASQLPLGDVRWNASLLALGEPPILARALSVTRLGEVTTPRSLHEVLFSYQPKRPFRLVVTHNALQKSLSIEQLKTRRSLSYGFFGGALADHDARNAFQAQDRLIEALAQQGGAQLFETTVAAMVFGHDEHELDQATRDVYDGFQEHNIASGVLQEEQFQGWVSSLPANGYMAPHPFTLLDPSCAHLTPLWLPSLGDTVPDLLLENRQRGVQGLTVRVGPGRQHAGALILGSTGSGKTLFFSNLLKYGCLDLGGHVVLVDVKGPDNSSLRWLCKMYGGHYISLGSDAEASFSPFPAKTQVFDPEGEFLEDVLEPAILAVCLMAIPHYEGQPDLEFWKAVALDVVKRAYMQHLDSAQPLILQHVLDAFEGYEETLPTKRAIAAEMRERLHVFLHSATRQRLFNQPKALDMSNPLTVFDFAGMEKDPRATMIVMAGLASHIEAKMRRLPKTLPKLFGFDEAWKLLEDSEAGRQLMGMLYRTARSYGACCYVLSQHENDILSSKVGQAIKTNSSLRFLMRRIDGHQGVAEAFDLDARQLGLFKSLKRKPGPYAEMLLVDTNESRTQVLQYWPTPFDYWIDTSRPEDVELRNRRLQESGRPLVEVIEELAERYPQGAPAAAAQDAA